MGNTSSRSTEMDIPTICFGFTLGFMVLTGSKVGAQSMSIWKRTKSVWNLYLFMIWTELLVCLAWSVSAWLFLRKDIRPSFGFFFYIATLWSIQTQCLLQIIANRVALIMTDKRRAHWLKLSLLTIVGLINVSVYCIWIPARMEISPFWVRLNEIWDRLEKVIYLFLDLGLNVYFLHLVRSRLISRGLTKYTPLFRFNAGIVVISICMDALIIGMMSLPNDLVYTQFHSLAYIVKLNIELCMADLISKVVRRQDRTDKPQSSSSDPSKATELTSKTRVADNSCIHGTTFASASVTANGNKNRKMGEGSKFHDAASDTSSDSGINFIVPENGIVKTVAVEHVIEGDTNRDGRGSPSGSTVALNKNAGHHYASGDMDH